MSPVEAFLRAAGPSGAPLATDKVRLEAVIAAHLEAGRAAWPEVAISSEDFALHLGANVAATCPSLDALAAVHGADLYLACGCARGDEAALRAFEATFVGPTVASLTARGAGGDAGEELRQALRTRLLVIEQGAPARIATYSGHAALARWVRTVASRAAVDLIRQRRPEGALEAAEVDELRAPGPDPELDYLKRLYRAELGQAFADTLAGLPVRDGNFLRLHFLEGMTMEAIASLFRISRRTVHRSITRSRREIFDKTRALLAERLNISQAEFDTIMGLARSQLHLSLQELFAAEDADRSSGPAADNAEDAQEPDD